MTKTLIENQDIFNWVETYNGEPFHALLCDPPYEIGLMDKGWDSSGVAFMKETWEALASVLHPGAFGMAFAAARGWHRMAVAIEDAGLRIYPSVFMLGWNYISGFPKGHRVKGVDGFDGHRYSHALKPALEPIIVFQKPYEGKSLECIEETGAGSLWVEGTMIYSSNGPILINTYDDGMKPFGGGAGLPYTQKAVEKRFPPNFVMAHHPDCNTEECVQDCIDAREMMVKDPGDYFEFAGWASEVQENINNASLVGTFKKPHKTEKEAGLEDMPLRSGEELSGGGGHSERYQGAYNAKKNDRRNTHPSIKPIALSKWLARLMLPPGKYTPRRMVVPFCGSGSEVIGSMQAGWDSITGIDTSAEFCEISEKRIEYWAGVPLQLEMFDVS